MKTSFINEDFVLYSNMARKLYHDYAAKMPIYDYHCHIPVSEIAENKQFENLTQIWLYGDHYKWRAMRIKGIPERFCTGDATDYEKFEKWAQAVPYTLRNPLYHWTHLELKRYFGIEKLLNPNTAKEIYDTCSEMLRTPEYSVRNILRKSNVKIVCTTDDPLDSLEHHRKLKEDGFEIKVLPAWRPDKAMLVNDVTALNGWIDTLAQLTRMDITDYDSYLDALKKRHDFFHETGCRLSDRSLPTVCAEDYTPVDIASIFRKIRSHAKLSDSEQLKFKSAMLVELSIMDYEKNWTQQFHLGAMRDGNTAMFNKLGPDTGFDVIGDFEIAGPLIRLLNRLNNQGKLAKTILYNANPRDNELMAALVGTFQDGITPGKIQFGSAWWFLDQKDGMTRQINALSNLGLLSQFVGMLTDSRCFLSYSRHEYFRRILCNILGSEVEAGELPGDMDLLGQLVEDICFNNAENYFGIIFS